jgi:hypothetical protein
MATFPIFRMVASGGLTDIQDNFDLFKGGAGFTNLLDKYYPSQPWPPAVIKKFIKQSSIIDKTFEPCSLTNSPATNDNPEETCYTMIKRRTDNFLHGIEVYPAPDRYTVSLNNYNYTIYPDSNDVSGTGVVKIKLPAEVMHLGNKDQPEELIIRCYYVTKLYYETPKFVVSTSTTGMPGQMYDLATSNTSYSSDYQNQEDLEYFQITGNNYESKISIDRTVTLEKQSCYIEYVKVMSIPPLSELSVTTHNISVTGINDRAVPSVFYRTSTVNRKYSKCTYIIPIKSYTENLIIKASAPFIAEICKPLTHNIMTNTYKYPRRGKEYVYDDPPYPSTKPLNKTIANLRVSIPVTPTTMPPIAVAKIEEPATVTAEPADKVEEPADKVEEPADKVAEPVTVVAASSWWPFY